MEPDICRLDNKQAENGVATVRAVTLTLDTRAMLFFHLTEGGGGLVY